MGSNPMIGVLERRRRDFVAVQLRAELRLRVRTSSAERRGPDWSGKIPRAARKTDK